VCGVVWQVRLRLLVVVERVVTDQLWLRLEPLIPVPERRYRFPGAGAGSTTAPRWKGSCSSSVPAWLERLAHQHVRRIRCDVLAPVERVVRSRRVATTTRSRSRGVAYRRAARPGACGRGLLASACSQRGDLTGPSPVDRGRLGSKHHLITDAGGLPLAVILTGGNRNDVTQLLSSTIQAAAATGRRRGHSE
jgi:hypothetical protein